MRDWLVVIGFGLVVGSAQSAEAQRSIVRGEVLDENEAAVDGAAVSFVGVESDRTYTCESGEKGDFVIMVPPALYRITVTRDGYRGAQFEQRIPFTDGMELPPVQIVSVQSIVDAETGELNRRFDEANALVDAGRLDEAQALFEQLAVEKPQVSEVHYNLGLILAKKEEWEAAEKALLETLKLQPDHGQAALALAAVYEKSGRTDEAAVSVETAAAERPDDVHVQIAAAYFHLNANRLEQARPYLERVLQLDSEHAEVHYLLATIATGEGDFAKAAALLRRYLELAPPDAEYRAAAESMLPQFEEYAAQAAEGGTEPQPEP